MQLGYKSEIQVTQNSCRVHWISQGFRNDDIKVYSYIYIYVRIKHPVADRITSGPPSACLLQTLLQIDDADGDFVRCTRGKNSTAHDKQIVRVAEHPQVPGV